MEATVIIPVLNEGERLGRCVRAVMAQRCRGPFEVLVVDGGSTDGSLAAVTEAGATLLKAPGTGAGEARNVGAEEARGRVLAFTDGDCIPQPGWLEALVDALDTRPSLGGVGGALRHLSTGVASRFEDLESRFFYRGCITSNVAYRADSFWDVGGFDAGVCCAEDWDLAWRVMRTGRRVGYSGDAVVVHDPAENAHYGAYLRKQVWYGRHDVPVLLRNAFDRSPGPGARAARSKAREHLLTAAVHASAAALTVSGVFTPLGLGLAASWAVQRSLQVAIDMPASRRDAPAMLAHLTVKALARGLGAWVGLGDVVAARLRPARRLSLRPAMRRAKQGQLASVSLQARPR